MLMRHRTAPAPFICTELPGPKAQKLIARDSAFTSPSYTRVYPLAVARGEGGVIEDVDGNRFLDFTAGIAVCSTGHCHPRVVRAIRRQAGRLIHMSGTDFYYGPQAALAAELARIAPGASRKRVFFTNSGTEAIEAAIKLARYRTGRSHLIAFFGGFHGRTLGSLSLTGSKTIQRRGFGSLLPDVHHVEYPNPYRFAGTPEQCTEATLAQIETLFKRIVSSDEVAAIVVEPLQGEGGYVVPPADFLPRLAQLAATHGILLAVDEVQSGMGRTGRMFACEHAGIEPDLLCTAKGIASGMPLGALIAKDEHMVWPPGSHASTFGGNPLSCVAALETIALLEEELIENARIVGEILLEDLRSLAERHACIGEVRGQGLMIGMELVCDRDTKEPDPLAAERMMQLAFERGLLLLTCGKNTLRFCPPLVIDARDVRIACGILEDAFSALERERSTKS